MQRIMLAICIIVMVNPCSGLTDESRPAVANRPTTVFIVRHAEKLATGRDPKLSEAGKRRAQDLARALRSMKLDACFASRFQRTQLTATPAAVAAGIKVTQRPAGKERLLADEIQRSHQGQHVLFVGHSNTVPALLKHLGVRNVPVIGESDYDNLFIVRMAADNRQPTVLRLHYGAANTKTKRVSPGVPKTVESR